MYRLLILLWGLLLAGCASPLVPAAHNPWPRRYQLSDAELLDCLRKSWVRLGASSITDEERTLVMHQYNKDLLHLIRRLRHDAAAGELSAELGVEVQDASTPGRLCAGYDDVVPAADVVLRSLRERYTLAGIGVPMVGIIPQQEQVQGGPLSVCAHGTVCALTAVLSFPERSRPLLRFVPLRQRVTMRIGAWNYPLAADWSAPMEVYWDLTRVRENRLVGLLRPQELRDSTGLLAMEPYNPDKIPVVLTHGLASSPGTFDNLVNRLLSEPGIRQNFQFWYYNYPTGVAWTVSARGFRESLERLRAQVDPLKMNPNWKHMVLVGHSMGGLITHYSQCVEPWNLLRAADIPDEKLRRYLKPTYVDAPFADSALEPLRGDYFFRPVEAGLVVYMATPHRGAPVARYCIVTLLSKLVTLPQTLLKEAYNIATLQQDMLILNPSNVYLWFTSINQLNPESYSIRGLQGLSVRAAHTHSIIGSGGAECPRCTDGVVPYWSSHLSWGSQTIVPADHSVQNSRETADDLILLLRKYAETHPAVMASGPHKQRALPRCTEPVNRPSSAVSR